MVEKYQAGWELTVGVMDEPVLPIIEIVPKAAKWYDYTSKYRVKGSEHICPARIPAEITRKANQVARAVYKAVGCRDLARSDFIWSKKDGNVYFLKVNTIPGMTPTSLVPEDAKAAVMGFDQFLNRLITNRLNSK